jgi:predicted DNA-binding transcriptional regulator AlpA
MHDLLADARADLERALDIAAVANRDVEQARAAVKPLENGGAPDELAGLDDLPTEDRLITPKEAAFLLQVSYQTIWRWQSDSPDELGVQRIGGKIRLSERQLLAFARRQPREK